jgi:hypothetical protein
MNNTETAFQQDLILVLEQLEQLILETKADIQSGIFINAADDAMDIQHKVVKLITLAEDVRYIDELED